MLWSFKIFLRNAVSNFALKFNSISTTWSNRRMFFQVVHHLEFLWNWNVILHQYRLQLTNSVVFQFNKLLPLFGNLIISIQLFVEVLIDFIPLIQFVCQWVQYLALFLKQFSCKLRRWTVPSMLLLQLLYFLFIFTYHFSLFIQNLLHWSAVRSWMDKLRVKCFYLFFEHLLLLSLFKKLVWSLLQSLHYISLILFNLFLLLF